MRTPANSFTAAPAAGALQLIAYTYLRSSPDGAVAAAPTIRFGRAVLHKVET